MAALIKQRLDPVQRVAVFLASLDPDVAVNVMQELDPEVMTKAAGAIRSLGMIPGSIKQQALSESIEELEALSGAILGSDGLAVGLLSKVVGEHQAASMLELGSSVGTRFGALASRSAEEVAGLLKHEPISAKALVLRYLPAQLASDTLTFFDEDTGHRILVQMASAKLPAEPVIDKVEKQLVSRLSSGGASRMDVTHHLEPVVSIIQRSSKEVAEAMLAELEKESADLANKVRDQLFRFEDIANLSDQGVRRLMQELESGVLSIALRKSPEAVKEKIYANMSRRAVETLEEEMEFAGRMPFSEVVAKQKLIVQTARRLSEDGEIQISMKEEEYV